MPTFLIVIELGFIIVLWASFTKRNLSLLNDNVGNGMNQMGVYLSRYFDLLSLLLEFTEEHAPFESQAIHYFMKSKRQLITSKSSTLEIAEQEGIISEVLEKIGILKRHYPYISESKTYIQTMEAIRIFETLIQTNRIIYNESVIQNNREIQRFPVCVVARTMGFVQRDFL